MEMGSLMNLNGANGYGSTGKLFVIYIMEIDNTTYEDLSLFSRHEEYSLFHKLNFTRTQSGRDLLLELFVNPLDRLEDIQATQRILRRILERLDQWPAYHQQRNHHGHGQVLRDGYRRYPGSASTSPLH